MLRWLTAGESHGSALTVIVDGLPAGIRVEPAAIEGALCARRVGYGRGGRSRIERDEWRVEGGVRRGRTTGAPVAIRIPNRDSSNWGDAFAPFGGTSEVVPITRPRPGHADFVGAAKYGLTDIRDVVERASARETCARVAAGALVQCLLTDLGIRVVGRVRAIGTVRIAERWDTGRADPESKPLVPELRCDDTGAAARMKKAIHAAGAKGQTLGGELRVVARGVPVGLGSYAQWDRRFDGRIGGAFLSIPGIKGVEIGDAVKSARALGSRAHDAFRARAGQVERATNHAGGIEGGITNGEPIICTAYMKPLPSVRSAKDRRGSVDLRTGKGSSAFWERSDICAVPAACVVAEAMMAIVIAEGVLEKFGGDSLRELRGRVESWRAEATDLAHWSKQHSDARKGD